MKTLNDRLHGVLDDALTELEEARNVSVAADSIVKFNQIVQGANMYCEFLARVNGLNECKCGCEKDQESPPS